jgi:hypothetical protein
VVLVAAAASRLGEQPSTNGARTSDLLRRKTEAARLRRWKWYLDRGLTPPADVLNDDGFEQRSDRMYRRLWNEVRYSRWFEHCKMSTTAWLEFQIMQGIARTVVAQSERIQECAQLTTLAGKVVGRKKARRIARDLARFMEAVVLLNIVPSPLETTVRRVRQCLPLDRLPLVGWLLPPPIPMPVR